MKRTPLKRRKPMTTRARFARLTMLAHEIQAQRDRLRIKQRNRCAACGRPLAGELTMLRPERAHVIGQGDHMRDKYGDEIIEHDLNVRLVCRGTRCNDTVSLSDAAQPILVAEHVARIKAAIAEELGER